jgi:hypothetical protein
MFSDTFTAADLVAVLNAVNVPVCFTVMVTAVVIIGIRRAFQRGEETSRRLKHAEDMERLRLSNTKEIAHGGGDRRAIQDYQP